MKVIHIATDDLYGAGRAACRMSDALFGAGLDSKVMVLEGGSAGASEKIQLTRRQKIRQFCAKQLNVLYVRSRQPGGLIHWDMVSGGIDYCKVFSDADIIHLHWINDGIWSGKLVKQLVKWNKPVVWTMHDMWPFTGGCHYDGSCKGYQTGCKCCPLLLRPVFKAMTGKEFEYKKRNYGKLNLALVGCSKWMAEEAAKSEICRKNEIPCVCIHNPVPSDPFKIYNRRVCREILGIPGNKTLVMFGAVSAASDERKGFPYLKEALTLLNPHRYVLGIFGTDKISGFDDYDKLSFGYISDDLHMALLYNAADVFVAPSVQENLANTVLESLCCGTPVVAFHIGGMPDMITSMQNGYLAEPCDTKALANGIEMMSKMRLDREKIRQNVMEQFSPGEIAKQYVELYMSMMKSK